MRGEWSNIWLTLTVSDRNTCRSVPSPSLSGWLHGAARSPSFLPSYPPSFPPSSLDRVFPVLRFLTRGGEEGGRERGRRRGRLAFGGIIRQGEEGGREGAKEGGRERRRVRVYGVLSCIFPPPGPPLTIGLTLPPSGDGLDGRCDSRLRLWRGP